MLSSLRRCLSLFAIGVAAQAQEVGPAPETAPPIAKESAKFGIQLMPK
jgi:hypothetical protein